MYAQGQGVQQNYAQVSKWYLQAGAKGDGHAQHGLGVLYDHGRGVEQSDARAAMLYRSAAELGYAEAQFSIGLMYEAGRGVLQDYTLAHMWFNLSGRRGYKRPLAARDRVAQLMTPSQLADAQRLAREWMQAHRAESKSPGPGR